MSILDYYSIVKRSLLSAEIWFYEKTNNHRVQNKICSRCLICKSFLSRKNNLNVCLICFHQSFLQKQNLEYNCSTILLENINNNYFKTLKMKETWPDFSKVRSNYLQELDKYNIHKKYIFFNVNKKQLKVIKEEN
mgnify:CR=1 FL=1